MNRYEFSLVLPIHNEEHNLRKNIKAIINEMSSLFKEYEIIIAEDGSTDGTYSFSKKISDQNENVKLIHDENKLGRGAALKRAFVTAKSDKVAYMDIDLATDIKHLKDLANLLEKYDIVTGSRLVDKSISRRKIHRYFLSISFNLAVRILFGSHVKDHQCGFKGFNKNVIFELNRQSKDNHWFWDTEILVLAQRNKYRIAEFPVEWNENSRSKVKIRRDVFNMGTNIMKLFFRFHF